MYTVEYDADFTHNGQEYTTYNQILTIHAATSSKDARDKATIQLAAWGYSNIRIRRAYRGGWRYPSYKVIC